MAAINVSTPPRLIRKPAVTERTGLPHSSLYAAIKDGKFPKPIKIGARSVAWLESDVDAWLDSRVTASKAA